MTPIGAILTLIFCIVVAAVPRRLAGLALLGATLYITQGQMLDIAGFDCGAIRFVEVFAFLRIIVRGELRQVVGTAVDRWLIYSFIVYEIALMARMSEFDKYGVGCAVDALIIFYSFRAFIATAEELESFLSGVAFLLLPFAIFTILEANTGQNLFALMGGVPSVPEFRNGHYRCQGSFRHAITAGSVGATFLPLFAGFLFDRRTRWWALLGLALSFIIVINSRSSGPLMGMVATVGAWACWPLRRNMKLVRRGILATLLGLHLVMKQPVWFIFDRISGIIGGDGWHRANLIDKFIMHFDQWWFWGMRLEDTGEWAATKMPWGAIDITNYYVSIGLQGGLISMVVFIACLVSCFRFVGRALQRIWGQDSELRPNLAPILWGAGCAVCGHAVNLLGVIYWDQSFVILYLHLAIAVGLASWVNHEPTRKLHEEPTESLDFTIPIGSPSSNPQWVPSSVVHYSAPDKALHK